MTPDTVTVELSAGRTAEVSARVTHGMARRVRAALARWQGQDPDAKWGAQGEIVVAMVQSWSLGEVSRAAVDALDWEDAETLFTAAVDAFVKGTARGPKGTASSASTPPGQP